MIPHARLKRQSSIRLRHVGRAVLFVRLIARGDDMAKKMQFPHPSELPDDTPVAWRSTENIVQLANEANGWTYKNLCATIQDWVESYARSVGWSEVHFPLRYPSRTLRAGAVFVK